MRRAGLKLVAGILIGEGLLCGCSSVKESQDKRVTSPGQVLAAHLFSESRTVGTRGLSLYFVVENQTNTDLRVVDPVHLAPDMELRLPNGRWETVSALALRRPIPAPEQMVVMRPGELRGVAVPLRLRGRDINPRLKQLQSGMYGVRATAVWYVGSAGSKAPTALSLSTPVAEFWFRG